MTLEALIDARRIGADLLVAPVLPNLCAPVYSVWDIPDRLGLPALRVHAAVDLLRSRKVVTMGRGTFLFAAPGLVEFVHPPDGGDVPETAC